MIPNLPSTYVDHLVSPRFVGDVEEPHGAGEIGSMVGGLGVRVSLAFEDGGNGEALIERIAGRVFGSVAPLAPVSWLAGHLHGTLREEALAVTADDICLALCDGHALNGQLPDRVKLGAEFAVRALHRALGASDSGPPADPTGPGILVCRCLGVGDLEIRRAVRAGARTPEAIGEACRACTGCRSCRPDLLALVDEETVAALPPPTTDLHPIERITLARAGATLRALGVDLEGAVLAGDAVQIRLGPPGPDAATSPIGAVALTRHILREAAWEDARVTLESP